MTAKPTITDGEIEQEAREQLAVAPHGNTAPSDCSASDATECVGCKTPKPAMRLYYVGGPNENEPMCAACVVDALLALRTKMQNDLNEGSNEAEW